MELKVKVFASLGLLRKLPPAQTREHINEITTYKPEIRAELLQKIEQPFELELDTKKGLYFFKTEFNKKGDSYRSPYTNEYFPPLKNPLLPSPYIRSLEEKAMLLFEEYLKMYYDQGIINTFFWDKEDGGMAGLILIKKECEKTKKVKRGVWNSINVVDIKNEGQAGKKRTVYKVTSTVILEMVVETEKTGEVTFSGNLTKSKDDTYPLNDETDETHLARIGKLVEEVESTLKNNIEDLYFAKLKQVALSERFQQDKTNIKMKNEIANELFAGLKTSEKILK